MTEETLTRRNFLTKAAVAGGVAVSASMLVACDKKEEAKPADKPADKPAEKAAAGCTDVSKLTDAEKKGREGLKYVDKTTDPKKACDLCALYTAGSPCGSCSAVKGPIAAKGTCMAFAPKA